MSSARSARDPVIVGVGESSYVGEPGPGQRASSSLHLHAEAARAALTDAGLAKEAIDGVYTNESYLDYHVRHAMAFAEYLGVARTARMITSIPLGSVLLPFVWDGESVPAPQEIWKIAI